MKKKDRNWENFKEGIAHGLFYGVGFSLGVITGMALLIVFLLHAFGGILG